MLICVDSADRELGHAAKSECHDGAGTLHRAFSVFLFNPGGQVLLQQRAAGKRLWPSFWSNSCCSHPRMGEEIEDAANRRLQQELGLHASLSFLYKFEYAAVYKDLGSEHELCSVFVGVTDAQPQVNDNEIAAWRWVSSQELTQQLQSDAQSYTPWLQLEWQRLQQDFKSALPG